MSELTEVIKLSKRNHKKLLAAGIETPEDLLLHEPGGLAEITGIAKETIQDWQAVIDDALTWDRGQVELEDRTADEPVIHLLTGVKRG